MAAPKVNVPFITLLGVILLAVAGGVAYMAYNSLKSSAADRFAAGERLAAQGDWEKAMRAYGDAVNKEQTNAQYLRKWIDAITKTKPASADLYRERYNLYINGLRKLGENLKTDPEAHRQLLDMQLAELRAGAPPAALEQFIRNIEQILSFFPEGDNNRKAIIRYRGIARLLLMSQNALPDDISRDSVKQDLLTALESNPKDQLVAATLSDWYLMMCDRARRDKDKATAEKILAEAREKIGGFIAANPPAPAALLALTRLEIADTYWQDEGKTQPQTLALAQSAKAIRVLDAIKQADPASVDESIVPAAIALAVGTGVDNAQGEGDKIFERLITGRPNDPVVLYQAAEMARYGQRYPIAIERYQKLIDMPDLPISTHGIMLLRLRDVALQHQFECALGIWETSKDDAKAAALAQAKSFRDRLLARLGENDPELILADAKLAFTRSDLVTARQLLARYMQSRTNDAQAMLLLARVLITQNQLGAARQQLERVVELRQASVPVYTTLAAIEGQLRNYGVAAKYLESALRLDPTNPALQQQYITLRNLEAGEAASNPIIRALNRAQRLMNQSEPDFDGAKRELVEAMTAKPETAQQSIMLVQGFVQLGDRENAIKVAEAGIASFPDNPQLPQIREALLNPVNPSDRAIELIDKSDLDDFQKAIQKSIAYRRMGKLDQSAAELERARALKPGDPALLGWDFELALQKRDLDAARKLADRAAELNSDKVGGAIFRAQLELAQGRTAEAIVYAQQATDRDPLNAVAWRLLGELRLQIGQTADGITALEKARSIKPDDAMTLTSLVRARMAAGRMREALALAREGSNIIADDINFFNLWCQLEFEFGDQIKAVERRARIFQMNPNDRANATELCRMMIRRRNFDGAAAVIAQLEKAEAIEGAVIAMKGVILAAKGDKEAAFTLFKQLLEATPKEQRKGAEHIYFAQQFAQNGFPDVAQRILEDGRPLQDPKDLPIDRELGDLLFNSAQYEKAAAIYQRLRDTLPEDKNDNILKHIIECHARTGKLAEAAALLDSAKERENNDQQLLLLRAQVALLQKNTSAARAALDRSIAINPNLAIAYYLRGQAGIDDPNLSRDAQADLEQALKLDPGLLVARRTLFRHFARQNQFERGFSIMRDGVNLNPDDAELRVELGQLMVANGQSEEALRLYQDAIRRQPKEPAWPTLCGEIYFMRRDMPRALDMYSKAWGIEKSAPTAVAYCDVLLSSETPDVDRAREVVDDPALDTPKSWPLLLVRARCNILQSKPSDADKDIAAALALLNQSDTPSVNSFFRGLLRAFFNPRFTPPDRPADAITALRRIAPTGGHTEIIRLGIARAQSTLPGQKDAAMSEFTLLADSKDKTVSLEALKSLGNMLYGDAKYQEAVTAFQKALAINDSDPEVLNNLAFALSAHLGRHMDALPFAKKAVEIVPGNASILDTLGSVQLALRDYEKAEETLRKALSVATGPAEKAMPLIHLILVRLDKGDRSGADQIKRELDIAIEQDRRIEERYRSDLESLRKRLAAGN